MTSGNIPAHLKPSAANWPQLGAFSYGFTDLDTLITSFKAQGLRAVQLGSELLDEVLGDPERARQLRSTLEEHGLYVAALAGYRNIVSPNETQRRDHIDFLKRCLHIAPFLGQPVVATETGTRDPHSDWTASPDNYTPETRALLYEVIGELLTTAEQTGSVLALEGYVNNILTTFDQAAEILAHFSSPNLGLVLDPYNYLSRDLLPDQERHADEFFHRFKDAFVVAHLKDVSPEGAEVNTPEFGTGIFPQKTYLDFLRRERPDLPLILEHLPWENFPAAVGRVHELATA